MPRRIDIELTSLADGAYTWRAAGAREPRGAVAAGMIPGGVAVGDVVRAEVESSMDGVEVVAVLATPEPASATPNRIEVVGLGRSGPDVSVSYASGGRRRREHDADGARPAPSRDRPARAGRTQGRDGRPGPGGGRARPRPHATTRDGVDTRTHDESRTPGAETGSAHRARNDRRGPRTPERTERSERTERTEHRSGRERPRSPSTLHRNALLATLGPQELPIAEQLLRGGMPAVRRAIEEQNSVKANGSPPVNVEVVLSIAEQLLARTQLATWKDHASDAQAAGRALRTRELRAVVAAARTVSLDTEARETAAALKSLLDERVQASRAEWTTRLSALLDAGQAGDALRAAARTPDPGMRLPSELAVRLAQEAGAELRTDSDPAKWTELLDAVVASPVCRSVKPAGIPVAASARDAALRAAGLVPELARLMGLPLPPPPPRRRSGVRRVTAAGGGGAGAAR